MAPKGSKFNNPFRKLGAGVKDIILSMAKGWTPTPSALAIQEAELRFRRKHGKLIVDSRGAHFDCRLCTRIRFLGPERMEKIFSGWNPNMGVPVNKVWTFLRTELSFELALSILDENDILPTQHIARLPTTLSYCQALIYVKQGKDTTWQRLQTLPQ